MSTGFRERSLTIGGGGLVNFGGGLRFIGRSFREGYNFCAPLGDVRVLLKGFCASEILSTA